MSAWQDDPFEVVVVEESAANDFDALTTRSVAPPAAVPAIAGAATARFAGFDLEDRPLVAKRAEAPGEVLVARTTVPLRRADIGSTVVLLFERGDCHQPIIVGVIQPSRDAAAAAPAAPLVSVQADDDRMVITAEREIVLRCGDASITLTRAGKVLIKGTYVLSRSSGYNKIKGAAVDIN